MKIALDCRWIFPSLSGIGIHTRELVRAFAELDTEHEFVLLYNDREVMERVKKETGFKKNPRFRTERVPYGLFALKNQVRLPFQLSRINADVFHSTNYMIPVLGFPRNRRGKTACVVTIHDLIPMVLRDHAPRAKKSRIYPVYRALMLQIAKRSDRIITVSEASKRDIIEQLRAPGDRVSVIHNGLFGNLHPAESRPAGPPTVLYVGRFDPYKNADKVVDSVVTLRDEGVDLRLRLVGKKDERYPEVEQRIAAAGLDVQWDEDLDDEALAAAYRESSVLALPSRYEGFGLPVLEAMQSGTPVVCGNRSSLPEVAGDAALLIDPDDGGALTEALRRVLSDASLADSLREKGIQRAAGFTWEKAARETIAVYESLAQV